MKFCRNVLFAFLIVAAGTSLSAAEATSPDEAPKFLDTLANEALDALRSNEMSLEQREAKVRGLLADNFDLEKIGRFVLGKTWREAGDDQRSEYQRLFALFVTQTYTKRLGGYSGEEFRIMKATAYGNTDVLVQTEISRPSGPPLRAGWRVRNGNAGLKILDVMVEGVSMVATQRSEFQAVLRNRGLDGLIEMLRLKVDKYSARGA